ncbi:zf-TFIIB domain-containing protein, partial [Thermodesulfobacteriota bacterium]
MSNARKKVRVRASAFLADFVRGLSEEELKEKYGVNHSQLTRLVGILKQKGDLGTNEAIQREENLKIRFGRPEGPPGVENDGAVQVDLDTGLVLHCPSCGASVKRDADNCEYCGSHLDFTLKGKTMHCPHCYQNIAQDSRFCFVCAKPVQSGIQEEKILEDRLCPRCQAPMIGRSIADFSIMGCGSCQGLFIPVDTFEMMQETSKRIVEHVAGRGRKNQPQIETHISYIRCPVCLNMMNRQNFARVSGVIIDICSKDGIWFDPGEMEKIMDFIARGGLQKARTIE